MVFSSFHYISRINFIKTLLLLNKNILSLNVYKLYVFTISNCMYNQGTKYIFRFSFSLSHRHTVNISDDTNTNNNPCSRCALFSDFRTTSHKEHSIVVPAYVVCSYEFEKHNDNTYIDIHTYMYVYVCAEYIKSVKCIYNNS